MLHYIPSITQTVGVGVPPIKLVVDATGVKAQSKIVEEAILQVNKAFGILVTGVATVNKAGTGLDTLSGKFVGVSKTGQKFGGTLSTVLKNVKTVDQAVAALTKQIQTQTQIVFANDAAFKKRRASVARGAKSAVPLTSGQKQFATPGETIRVDESIEKLSQLAQQAQITSRKLNKMFRDVAAGNVKKFEGELINIQRQVIKVVDDIRRVGVAGEAAFNKAQVATKKEAARLANVTFEAIRAKKALAAVGLQAAKSLKRNVSGRQQFAAQATPIEKNRVAQSEEALRKLARTAQVTGKQIDAVFADVNRGQIKSYEGTLARVQTAVVRIQTAQRGLGASAEAAHLRAAKAAQRQQAALDKTKAKTNSLVASIKSLANVVGIAVLIGGVFRLQQALLDGTEAAIEFSKRIAEVQTIQGKAGTTTTEWAEQLRRLSDAYGVPIIDQAEAAYQTLSNQVAKGAEAFIFLEAANKLAITAVTDSSTAVNLLTSVINAFGLNVGEAEEIAAKLFKTVELGRVRIDEMSETLGRIAVPAAKLGIRFEELLASIAVTTRQGIRFNEASTLMRGILLKLVKPTKEMKELFNELGFASAEAAVRTLGLPGVLAEIDKKAQGSSTELGKLFNRVRGTTGALIFAGEGLVQFNEELGKIDSAGVEELGDKTKIITQSIGKQFEIELTKINNIFKDFGQDILKSTVSFSNNFVSLSDAVKGTADAMLFLAKSTIPILIGAVTALTVKLIILAKAFLFTPVGALTALIVGLSFAAVKLSDNIQDAKDEVVEFNKSISQRSAKAAAERLKDELKITKEIVKGFKIRGTAFLRRLAQENQQLFKQNKFRFESVEELTRLSKEGNASIIKNAKSLTTVAGAEFKKLSKDAGDTAKDISKSFLAASKQLFDFDIGVVADKAQLKLVENQLASLRTQQQAAAEAGDKANFNRITKQIDTVAKQRFTLTQRAAKAQRKADQDIFKARADLVRAEGTGDKARVTNAKNALKDAQRARRTVGTASQEELNVQNQIIAKRRELRAAGFQNEEADALKLELQGLQQLQASLGAQAEQQSKQRQAIVDNFTKEKDLRLKLQETLNKNAEKALKDRLEFEIQAAKLVSLEKRRNAFDLAKLLETESDPKKLAAAAKRQQDLIRETIKLQDASGVGSNRVALEKEIANIAAVAANQQRLLENKAEFARRRNAELALAREFDALSKVDDAQKKIDDSRLKRVKETLDALSQSLPELNAPEERTLTGFRGTTKSFRGTASGQGRAATLTSLEQEIKILSKVLVAEAKTPGSFSAATIQAMADNLGGVIEKFQKTSAGGEDLTGAPKLFNISSLIEELRLGIAGGGDKKSLSQLTGEAAVRRKFLTDLQEQFAFDKELEAKKLAEKKKELDAQKGFIKRSQALAESALKLEEERKKSQAAREDRLFVGPRLENAGPSRVEAEKKASGQMTKNRQEAEKQAAGQMTKNRVEAEKAAGKERQTQEQAATDKRLKDKEAADKAAADLVKQAEAQKGPGKLTGIAARIQASDEGRGTSTFDIRKQQAEQRRLQGERNETFLRKRRARKDVENRAANAAAAAKEGGPAGSLAEQLQKQLAAARESLATSTTIGETGDALTSIRDLEKQIKILAEVQRGPTKQPDPLSNIPVPEGVEGTSLFVDNTEALSRLTTALESLPSLFENLLDVPFTHAGDAIRNLVQDKTVVQPKVDAQGDPFDPEFRGGFRAQTLPRDPRLPDFSALLAEGAFSPGTQVLNEIQVVLDGRQIEASVTERQRRTVGRTNPGKKPKSP